MTVVKEVLAFDPDRTTNAQAIEDAHRLGWLPEPVFDATYNTGKFWANYEPDTLVTNDIAHPAVLSLDWTEPLPTYMHSVYATVVFDPDYKMQGTPSAKLAGMNHSYGVDVPKTTEQRLQDMRAGATNLAPLVQPLGFMLVKCMDQIFNGRYGSQTKMFFDLFDDMPGWRFVSWLHVSSTSTMPQRSQKNPRNNYSTLMAFQRRKGGATHPTIRKVAA